MRMVEQQYHWNYDYEISFSIENFFLSYVYCYGYIFRKLKITKFALWNSFEVRKIKGVGTIGGKDKGCIIVEK